MGQTALYIYVPHIFNKLCWYNTVVQNGTDRQIHKRTSADNSINQYLALSEKENKSSILSQVSLEIERAVQRHVHPFPLKHSLTEVPPRNADS